MNIVPQSKIEQYQQARANYYTALAAADDAWQKYYSVIDEPYSPDVSSRDYAEHHQKAAYYMGRARRADERQKAAYKVMGHCYRLVDTAPAPSPAYA